MVSACKHIYMQIKYVERSKYPLDFNRSVHNVYNGMHKNNNKSKYAKLTRHFLQTVSSRLPAALAAT